MSIVQTVADSTTNDSSKLYTYSDAKYNTANHNDIEKQICIALSNETPDVISLPTNSIYSSTDITQSINDEVMINSDLNESHFIMRLDFKNDTPIDSSNIQNSQDIITHNAGNSIIDTFTGENLNLVNTGTSDNNFVVKHNMELGSNTCGLYNGFLKFYFEPGPDKITANNGNTIIFDKTEIDYNLHKTVNSITSTLNTSSGYKSGYDNDFNSSNAFYTENIVSRISTNNQLYADSNYSLGNDGLSSVFNISIDYSTSNIPFFGSLQISQGFLKVSFDSENNTTNISNVSILDKNTDTSSFPINTTATPTAMSESEFNSLFEEDYLSTIAPGWNFELIVGENEKGGFTLNYDNNKVNIPTYDNSNIKTVSNSFENMFNIELTNVSKNLGYMLTLKNHPDLIDKHKLILNNGNYSKNTSQSTNKNYSLFDVCDGAEQLTITTINGINDLEKQGNIKVFETNNINNDPYSRYTKVETAYSSNIPRLIVNYETTEQDYLPEVGVVNSTIQENYYVNSEIKVLLPSTNTSNNTWNGSQDVAYANDTVMVYQNQNNILAFDKSSITDYNASVLGNQIDNNTIGLLQINSYYDYSSTHDETPMITTYNSETIEASNNIRFSNINLNDINTKDLRVLINCKKKTDIPVITALNNSPVWNWNTSDQTNVFSVSNNSIVDKNNQYLISSKNSKNYLGPDTYKMMYTNTSNTLNITIDYETNDEAVENKDILENRTIFTIMLLNSQVNNAYNYFINFKTLYNNAVNAYKEFDTIVANYKSISSPTPENDITVANAANNTKIVFYDAYTNLASINSDLNLVIEDEHKQKITNIDNFLKLRYNKFSNYGVDPKLVSTDYIFSTDNHTLNDTNTSMNIIEEFFKNNLYIIDAKHPVDESDIQKYTISETTTKTSTEVIDSSNTVYGYMTETIYLLCIRFRIGPYKNLYAVTRVTEQTNWFQLYDTNQKRIIPDYYLRQIKDINNNNEQRFKATRNFIDLNNQEVLKQSCSINFNVYDLMGFTCDLEYQLYDNSWNKFSLSLTNLYAKSLDPMFDNKTELTLMNPTNTNNVFGTVTLSIDTSTSTVLGLANHKSTTSDAMYMIHLSNAEGRTSFETIGYTYQITDSLELTNENSQWSPYNSGSSFFFKNKNNNNIFDGTSLSFSTEVEQIDNTNNSVPKKIKVNIYNNSTLVVSFTVNKWILTNFNIIVNKQAYIQHKYNISKLQSDTRSIEFLKATGSGGSSFYSKLLFGGLAQGIRVELLSSIKRGDISSFKLLGDRIQIDLLANPIEQQNEYIGLYSNSLGTEILPSVTGYPLRTTSLIHRNIIPKLFRGYKKDATISVLRTKTTIKFMIDDKFTDNLDNSIQSTVSSVWKDRGVGQNNIYTKLSPHNNKSLYQIYSDIGDIGFDIIPNYSMFTQAEIPSLTEYIIKIDLTFADYKIALENTVNNVKERTLINGFVDDVYLYNFKPYSIVTTQIMVKDTERYKFSYSIPGTSIYLSNKYVGDVRTFTDWVLYKTYTDDELRSGVYIGNTTDKGVVKITRDNFFVQSFVKYGILPRPIAFLEAFSTRHITNDTPYPYDLSSRTRSRYYIDVDITNPTTKAQGLAAELQTNKPFNNSTIPNNINSINPVTETGLNNNIILGLNISRYLNLRQNFEGETSYTMVTNKLTLYSGIGPISSSNNSLTKVFEGYISELNNSSKWLNGVQSTMQNTSFNNSTKQWNIVMSQAIDPINGFLNMDTVLKNPSVYVNGIPTFPLGCYYLQIAVTDSVEASYYNTQHRFNKTTGAIDVSFYKYTSVPVINWATNDQFTKSENFRPVIAKREEFKLSVNIENKLTTTRLNITELIKEYVRNNIPQQTISWSVINNSKFIGKTSPIRIAPLTIKGSYFLHSILFVNKEFPCKLFGFNRPPIFLSRSSDGGIITKITPDGHLSVVKISTTVINLLPIANVEEGTQTYLNSEYFANNIDTIDEEVDA